MEERKRDMRKRITLLIVALVLALTMSFGSVAAFAANAPAGCEKVRGTIVCEESGKNTNQPKFQQTTFKKGSVNSSHEEEVVCGTPCPPGQFKD
jgi:hypothetical protein